MSDSLALCLARGTKINLIDLENVFEPAFKSHSLIYLCDLIVNGMCSRLESVLNVNEMVFKLFTKIFQLLSTHTSVHEKSKAHFNLMEKLMFSLKRFVSFDHDIFNDDFLQNPLRKRCNTKGIHFATNKRFLIWIFSAETFFEKIVVSNCSIKRFLIAVELFIYEIGKSPLFGLERF